MAKHCARVRTKGRPKAVFGPHFAPREEFFPPRMSPGKMIRILSGLRRKPGRGFPFLDLSPGDGGRRSPVNCLLLSECLRSGSPLGGFAGGRAAAAAGRGSPVGCLLLLEVPAVRLAAERLRRRKGRCGGRTKVPGQLPASIGSACDPARHLAALPARGCRCCVAKGSLVERGTFASAAGGGKSAQKGVAVVKIL